MSILSKVASIVTNPAGAAIGLITDIASKLGTDKVSDVVQALQGNAGSPELQAEVDESVRQHEERVQKNFQDFTLAHSGAAKDLPKSMQILRACIRPTITIWAMVLFNYCLWYLFNLTDMAMVDPVFFAMKLVFGIVLVTVGFWFGDQALQRSGVVELIRDMKNKKD